LEEWTYGENIKADVFRHSQFRGNAYQVVIPTGRQREQVASATRKKGNGMKISRRDTEARDHGGHRFQSTSGLRPVRVQHAMRLQMSLNGTAAKFTLVSSSEITTTVPANATTGEVKVVTPSDTLSSNVSFHVP